MSDNRPTLGARSDRRVPEHIRDRKGFKTHGGLSARVVDSLGSYDSGKLRGPDEDVFRQDCGGITYVVWSYSTPIAWYTEGRGWYVVGQRFSATTSKHQGKLYLIPRAAD